MSLSALASRWGARAAAFVGALALVAACAAPIAPPVDDDTTGPPTPPPAGTGAWHTLPATGLDRQEVAYAHVDGKLYLAGGSSAQQVYDPVAETWSDAASLDGWIDHIQAAVVDGRIYYIGGLTGWPAPHSDLVQIYDPVTDSFSAGTPMARGRGGGGVAVHNGLIYYAGGLHDGEAVNWFDVYDPAAGTWTQLPAMPTVRDHFHAAVLNGVFYAIGGRDTDINAMTPRVDAYDIASGTWSTLDTELPTPRGGFAAAVLGDEILVIGGEGGGQTFAIVEAYRPASNSWRTLAPMQTARHGIQAAVCDGGVYIAAGGVVQGHGPTDVHEVFFFDEPVPCGAGSFSSVQWSRVVNALAPGRTEAQGLAVGDTLYVIGGYTSWGPDPLCTTGSAMAYHVPSDTWSALAPLPALWTHGGAVYHDGSLYLAGGRANDADCTVETSTTTVWRYDIATDSWHDDVPPLPEARSSGGFAKVGTRLHFFSGVSSGHPGGVHEYFREESDHWVLDLAAGTAWQPRAPLPEPRSHLAAVALGGMIYAIGGQDGEGGHAGMTSSVHRYDPATDSWSAVAPLPATLSHHTASTFTLGGRILVLGGERVHAAPVTDVLAYDPASDAWSTLTPLPVARRSAVAGFAGGAIVLATGAGHFEVTTYRGAPAWE
jgi:N-acetylneuraminic acid mutarotase